MILGAETVTRRRYGAQSIVNFRPTWPAPVESIIRASVQPTTGRDLLSLPEGDRVRDVQTLYTTSDLRVADTATGARADEVVIRGQTYEIRKVERWTGLLGHYKALAVLVQEVP